MFKSSRKIKKRGRRKSWFSALILFSFLSIIALFLSFYVQSKKSPFISPLPFDFKINSLGNTKVKKIEESLRKSNLSFSSVVSSDSSFIVKFKNGEEIILDSEKSIEEQISSLQLILSRLTIEGKRFTRLDFRFDKPVINIGE